MKNEMIGMREIAEASLIIGKELDDIARGVRFNNEGEVIHSIKNQGKGKYVITTAKREYADRHPHDRIGGSDYELKLEDNKIKGLSGTSKQYSGARGVAKEFDELEKSIEMAGKIQVRHMIVKNITNYLSSKSISDTYNILDADNFDKEDVHPLKHACIIGGIKDSGGRDLEGVIVQGLSNSFSLFMKSDKYGEFVGERFGMVKNYLLDNDGDPMFITDMKESFAVRDNINNVNPSLYETAPMFPKE